jgi:general secretion pathway protein K
MALILTLMVVAIITAMVVEFAYGVYVSTNALHNWQASQRLSLVAKSATQLGSGLLAEKTARLPYTYPGIFEMSQKAPFEEIDSTITLRIEDENAKFNINSLVNSNGTLNEVAYTSFARLLKALGLKPETADRLVDWIDPDSQPRAQGTENRVKNGFLDSIDELVLIPGIERETYERLQPYVTIYGNRLININGAEVPVIMSLSDKIDRQMAENLIRYREIAPFEKMQDIFRVAGFETEGTPLMGYITVKGSSFRIVATASSGDIKRIIDTVVDISGSSRMVRYWKEL